LLSSLVFLGRAEVEFESIEEILQGFFVEAVEILEQLSEQLEI